MVVTFENCYMVVSVKLIFVCFTSMRPRASHSYISRRSKLLHLSHRQHPLALNDEETDEEGNGWSFNADEDSDSDIENLKIIKTIITKSNYL